MASVDDDRVTELLEQLVEQYSPTWAEEPAVEVVASALGEAGIPYLRQPVSAGGSSEPRGNLLVELGNDPQVLMWVGHLDTIPPLDEALLAPRREGDLLYGLGAADMKGACAAMVEALIAVTSAGIEPDRGFTAAFVVGEEEYGDGSEALLERATAPLTVIGEPTGLAVATEHFGYFEHRLHCTGDTAHAALPEVGSSAIHAMLGWLTALHEEASGAFGDGNLAVNLREIEGGGDLFVVPAHCAAVVDIHAAPGIRERDVARLLDRARASAGADHPGCAFDHDSLFSAEGFDATATEERLAPLVRAFERSGTAWSVEPFRSHSDAPLFREAGSTPVICGPGRLEVAHTRREHVSLREVRRAARIYAAMICEACTI